jgi:small subunit ribosomal protein S6
VSPPSRFRAFPRLAGLGAGRTNRNRKGTLCRYTSTYFSRARISRRRPPKSSPPSTRIEQNGGQIVGAPEYWGVKTLNYRIRKNRKAHFAMLRLDAPPKAVEEMERQERINEDVIRFLTIRVDQHEEGPSIMLQKRDRDERREERRGRRDRDGDEGEVDIVAPEVEEVRE